MPSVCFTTMEFTVSGLLWPRLSTQTCFYKSPLSDSAPAEVPGLGLVLQRSLALIFSLGVPDLVVPGLAEDLAQAYSLRGPRLMPRPTEFSGSCLLPQRSQTHTQTHRGPDSGLAFHVVINPHHLTAHAL